jgi:SNF2 family DNA or RNA helicase
MIWTPRPWQPPMVDHMTDIERNATWAGTGTGKTGTALIALKMVQDLLDPRPALVLAPKRVASRTWPREVEKWDNIDGDCTPILGSPAERLGVLRRGIRAGNSRLYTINYENLVWLLNALTDLKMPWPFATVIADESTKLKSFRIKQGGKRTQAFKDAAWEAERFWELTGTPSPNGLLDLWGQLWFLDQGKRLGQSYTAYRNRWFKPGNSEFAQWTPFDHSADQIHPRLTDICLSVSVPVDKPIVNKVYVDLPDKVRGDYKRMEEEALIEIKDRQIEAINAATKMNKFLQIASGHVYDEDHVAHHLHDAKIEALESIIEEAAGMPVLVVVNFQFEAPHIIRAFGSRARQLRSDKDIDDFAAGKIPIGIAHPASVGHGINDMEHGTNIGVFFSGDWNLEFHDQVLERIGPMRQKQSGYDRPVYLHYILAEGTIDEEVFERRIEKISVQEALKRATQRRT